MAGHSYGRGKFEAHKKYVEYMQKIVQHPNFSGMPNAVSADGRINWQVSSGKTTSFYKDYLDRKSWWKTKVQVLGLSESDADKGLFTVAARLINPTGYRPCRLCGSDMNVGYFYLNHIFNKKLSRDFPGLEFEKASSISKAIETIGTSKFANQLSEKFQQYFPERDAYFIKYGVSEIAFEKSNHIKTTKLSPGYMGNPPDRLDGFHDYCLNCRKKNDPGRHDENMRSYNRDRRAFVWWAEGNWALADKLYNSAGPGLCSFDGCEEVLGKVSPDHIGPLACGFKQLPLFAPSCPRHNSAKNRRFSHKDVKRLIDYEQKSGLSVASWQVRAHWDLYKGKISSDREALSLSNSMRSLQDMYFRVLRDLLDEKKERFLATLLHPEYAVFDYEFSGLNTGTLTFDSYREVENTTDLRLQQRVRVLRVAFESLREYTDKTIQKRKMVRSDYDDSAVLIRQAVTRISELTSDIDADWVGIFEEGNSTTEEIAKKLQHHRAPESRWDDEGRQVLQKLFNEIGSTAPVDFERYGVIEDS